MKKLLSLVLCLLMVTFAGAALAETAETADSIESAYEGVWVTFEDAPSIYLPADWLELEVTEELAAAGLFYVAASPDGAYTCQLYWSALEENLEVEGLLAVMQTLYPSSQLIELNGAAFVCFADAEADVLGFAALDAVEITLIDHIVVAEDDFVSMMQSGYYRAGDYSVCY